MKGNKRNESGIPSAYWVFGRLIQIQKNKDSGKKGERTNEWEKKGGKKKKEDSRSFFFFLGRFWEKSTEEQEMSNCSRVCPSMFLVTLGILTHIRFLCMFVFEYLIYCWLVWTESATNCFVDISCLLVCPKSVCDLPH